MNNKVLYISLLVIILIILFIIAIFFLVGGGIHTEYKFATFNFQTGVAEQEFPRYIGIDRSYVTFVGMGRTQIKLIPLGSITKVVSRFCEIEYAGINRYTIICRESENSPNLIPIVNQYYTEEELRAYDFTEFPKDSYPNSSIKIIPKV
jgi:hypothetical protein